MFLGENLARFGRYMLSQLLLHFGFFALVLVLIYWVNRAVVLFDQLIANGETAWVVLEFTALSLPLIIAIVLPIAAAASAIFVTNKLANESELVVAEAAGYSPFRLSRPVFAFGIFTGVFIVVLTHVLVPMSQIRLAERQAEVSQNVSARFLTEGRFVHPSDGITVYIREITADGEIHDIFLSDDRDEARHYIYTAQRALIMRTQSGPRLLMFRGLAQVLEADGQRLSITGFDDFTYDISSMISDSLFPGRTIGQLYTPSLLKAAPALLAETGSDRATFLFEAHFRTAQGILSLVAALTGFSVLLLGGFSRFGLWRQIFGAVVLIVVLKFFDNAMANTARSDVRLFWVIYLPGVFGLALNLAILWVSARPALYTRRSRQTPEAPV